jgi:hypothetical protein
MPVRVTNYWRPALKAIARLQHENAYPEFEFFWRSYTRTQQKAVRRMRRDLLSKMQRTDFEPLTPTQHAALGIAAPAQHGAVLASVLPSTAEKSVGELIVELSEFVRNRSKK